VNPNLRKVALIAASLGLLLSLFIALRRGDDDAVAPATTAPAATEPPAPDVITIRIAVGSDTAPKVRHFSVEQGRKVEIVVTSELADEVHVHGYDLMADVAPGAPVTIAFTATAPGLFEIELEDHHLPIAELEVRP